MALESPLIRLFCAALGSLRVAVCLFAMLFAVALGAGSAIGQEAPAPTNGAPPVVGDAARDAAPASEAQAAPTGPSSRAAAASLVADLLPTDQPGITEELRQTIRRLPLELDRLQKAMQRLQNDSEGLATVRQEAEELQSEAQGAISTLIPLLPGLRTQLERLGDPPGEGEPPEIPVVQTERDALNTAITTIDGAIKRLRLTETRAAQLLSRLQFARHNLFARDLLVRSPSAFSPTVWQGVIERAGPVTSQFLRVFATWLDRLAEHAIAFAGVLVVAALGYVISRQMRQVFVARRVASVRDAAGSEQPGFIKRTWLAGALAPAFALPGMLAAAIVAGGIYGLGLNNRQIDPILLAILTGFLIFVAVASLSRAVLIPRHGDVRLVGVDDAGALRLHRLVSLLALVWAVDGVNIAIIETLYLSEPYAVVAGTASAFAFAALLIAIVTTPIEDEEATEGGRQLSRALRWSHIPVFIIAAAIIVAAAIGYLTLARFIAGQTLVLGCGLIVVYLFHRAIIAATRPIEPGAVEAAASSERDGADGFLQRTRVSDLLRYTLQALLALFALFGIALSWGYSVADIGSWTRTLIVGFDVGGMRVSPAQILGALLLFAGLLVVTRLFQRWLSRSFLDSRRMDPGLANSIHTGVGYAGTAIAVLAGISYAGFNVTNLAIVAGALSVGIGFGLQSIVNNFVSGLILLIERPIKVGDWIVVGEHQGYVRRISVRSTEIETFDRASLILPNSDLITGTVQNWTHRNSLGRVQVPVGVSYDSDPEHVLQTLKAVLAECDSVLKFPAPFISFDSLGDSALEFTVRAFVKDVNNSLSAKTEIRSKIVVAFREAGIEIPFPQQDIHLRDLDGVRTFLAAAAARKAEADDGEGAQEPPTVEPITPLTKVPQA